MNKELYTITLEIIFSIILMSLFSVVLACMIINSDKGYAYIASALISCVLLGYLAELSIIEVHDDIIRYRCP